MGVDVAGNLKAVLATLPEGVGLVAVSKFHDAGEIMAAYDAGQRVFGESHERELTAKRAVLPSDIEWHFIGHLQTNKVKHIAPYISMIHSVDSPRLLGEINRQAERNGRVIRVLLELHIAGEATKYGFGLQELRDYLALGEWRKMGGVRICGLMMMASNVDDDERIGAEFDEAAAFFDEVKRDFFPDDEDFRERSWGMSDDYPLAVRSRSTMVRVGTAIFGERVH